MRSKRFKWSDFWLGIRGSGWLTLIVCASCLLALPHGCAALRVGFDVVRFVAPLLEDGSPNPEPVARLPPDEELVSDP